MDSFTSALRKRTDCSYCEASICRACLQTCLLMDNAAEPVCPSCRAAWSREFLNNHLTAAFRNGPFKKYREKVLVDRERARLPETQEDAAAYKAAKEFVDPIDKKITELRTKIDELPSKKAADAARLAYYASRKNRTYGEWTQSEEFGRLHKAMNDARLADMKATNPFRKQIKELNKGTREHRYIRLSFGRRPLTQAQQHAIVQNALGHGPPVVVEEKAKAVFIQKCPAETCEGFLSTQWICGLCNIKVCKDCHEPKVADAAHICDPELVESIKAIKKEAKPCPKCASQISKIDGCDQMWCTQCKTAFSWNTGKIETHIIHNPHYFQWMRTNGGMPRAPGDAPPNPCGVPGALDAQLQTILNTHAAPRNVVEDVRQFLRLFLHIQHVEIRGYRGMVDQNERDEWRRQLRVRRMVQEITENEWKIVLQRKEKETLKARDKLQLLEMYRTAGMDILGQIMTGVGIVEVHTQLRALCDFTEKASKKIADVYNCTALAIDPMTPYGAPPAARWYY